MTNVKRAAIVGAVVATLVPALAFARKRAKGRKVVHAPKVRKTRSRRATAPHKGGSRRVK